ncbi:PilN domain-containing protein [Cupriavidus plantarum]|uniref:PilN domain-containing protein n=2 Tax=Cupriavidus plantarum TaxID=942865 RepID=UPI00339D53AE
MMANPASIAAPVAASTSASSASTGAVPVQPIVDTINLLPYRDQQRQAQRRGTAMVLAFACGCAVLALLVARAAVTHAADNVVALNAVLAGELREIDQRVGEIRTLEQEVQALVARQSAIAVLQRERMQAPRLLAELTAFVPPTVYVSTLEQRGSVVTLTGVSATNQEVSALLANMGRTSGIRDPQLRESRTSSADSGGARSPRRNAFDFTVSFTYDGPPQPAEGGRAAALAADARPDTQS